MRKLALILALCAGPALSQSSLPSGNDYLGNCTDLPNDPNVFSGWCIGYAIGAFEGIKAGSARTLIAKGYQGNSAQLDAAVNQHIGTCIPDQVENGQLIAVLLKYLNDNPEIRHLPVRTLIFEAYGEAFPCG